MSKWTPILIVFCLIMAGEFLMTHWYEPPAKVEMRMPPLTVVPKKMIISPAPSKHTATPSLPVRKPKVIKPKAKAAPRKPTVIIEKRCGFLNFCEKD